MNPGRGRLNHELSLLVEVGQWASSPRRLYRLSETLLLPDADAPPAERVDSTPTPGDIKQRDVSNPDWK